MAAVVMEAVTPRIETLEQSDTYGKFVVEPLEPGYGVTLGNSLRRVLLSSIEGAAITAVKIEGVQHEFQTIPGLKEDATELLLNLKGLFVKVYDDRGAGDEAISSFTRVEPEARVIRVEARGAGRITGADVICPPDVEVANPDAYIATISEETGSLYMELKVQHGRGYVVPERSVNRTEVIGEIPVPAAFGPVRKMNYTVDPTRVGNRTDFERLVLEITTNGTVKPSEALSQAAQTLSDYFLRFVEFPGQGGRTFLPQVSSTALPGNAPDARIEELDFSVRTYNCLKKANVLTVGELAQITEADLMNIRNFGKKSLTEVKEKLNQMGLSLKDSDGVGYIGGDDDEDEE
ncbi:MAG TPA: DNA-directed RNA polymerase subunit alpha [Armatimonadaceae bacterium]|jgi:DNA-directed RNA polymerase subunit alpha|nr:DNA-directed RNA polymerase subunit alpha [Armatimonadaceae bacterium]